MTGEHYQALFNELGITCHGRNHALSHPRQPPPLKQRRSRDGSVYFAARRQDRRSFDPLLWREVPPRRKSASSPDTVTLAPVVGSEAEAFWQLLYGDSAHEAALALAEYRLAKRTDLTASEKHDLLRARRGLGLFREEVERHELACRVTGLQDRRHLRAVHIKPWLDCSDHEKLDGFNGLLLSPHVAHLFERGQLSFADSGSLMVAQSLNPAVLDKWDMRLVVRAGGFRPEQMFYLAWHRERVFEFSEGGRRVA